MGRVISKAIIPAAGLGTRLLPITKSQPKEMIPIGRKPVIQHVVEELTVAGIHQLLMVTSRKKRTLEDHFDHDPELNTCVKSNIGSGSANCNLYFVRQEQPLGTGHAILLGEKFTSGEPFLVANGDTIIQSDHAASLCACLIEEHRIRNSAATIAVEMVSRNEATKYGVIEPGLWEGNVTTVKEIVEKPSADSAPSPFVVASRYVFDPVIYFALKKVFPTDDGELQLTAAIRWLLKNDYPVYALRIRKDEHRLDLGNFECYFKGFIFHSFTDDECGEEVRQYARALLRKLED